jgi:RNA polymerase primary sigma factor
MRKLDVSERITKMRTESIKRYFSDINNISILTSDEEYELATLSHQGDEDARKKLVKHNLRFVISVAKQYETNNLTLEDLINEGNIGLIKASEKFDPTRGFKFISYAVYWIRRNILAFIGDNNETIRIPINKVGSNYKINQKCSDLEQKILHSPSYNEFMNHYGDKFNSSDVKFYFDTLNTNTTSLDNKMGTDRDEGSLVDLIEDEKSMGANHFTDETDNDHKRNHLLNMLTKKKEREVIKLLFGMDGKEPMSLKTTGFVLGVSSERVRQIREMALENFREILGK